MGYKSPIKSTNQQHDCAKSRFHQFVVGRTTLLLFHGGSFFSKKAPQCGLSCHGRCPAHSGHSEPAVAT